MADVVVTMKIMPESPDADLGEIEKRAKAVILSASRNPEVRAETEPVAFGLKALNITFLVDESKGDTEDIEKKIGAIAHVSSVEVTDVRRAMG